jgi:membrane AbrB-like protein
VRGPSAHLSKLPRSASWGLLFLLSGLFAALLTWARLPAALMLGPMIAGILMENGGAHLRVPKLPFIAAQAVLGCMIARILTPDVIHSFERQWMLFLGVGLLVTVASCLLVWIISRLRILPETTAIWGLLPGAASAMMIMADAYGADARLVAFMQYLRIVLVALLASIITRFWVHASGTAVAPVAWFAPIDWLPFAETLALVLAGVILGPVSRIPAGIIMVPMFVGIVLQASGLLEIVMPRWLVAASFLFIGWTIGLRFTRNVLLYALHALPQIVLSILAMMLFCGGVAFILVELLGIDPLTAYLATSPGGIDGALIIGASTKVDLGFVMALQVSRFMSVLVFGPILSRFAADRISSSPLL